jgi:hypothetical protein
MPSNQTPPSKYPPEVAKQWMDLMQRGRFADADKLATPYDNYNTNLTPDDTSAPGYAKGGKVKKTGPAKVHKGEQVIKKSAAQKYGVKKLGAVNRGTARISPGKK